MSRLSSAPWVLLGAPADGARRRRVAMREGAVALDGDTVVAVGPRGRAEPPASASAERLDAVLLPALVNAHLHLELSHLAGRVPGGEGLPAWIERFVQARVGADGEGEAAPAMAEAPRSWSRRVAAVGDVSNSLASLAPLAAAGLAGTIFHEVFGAAPDRLAAARKAARARRATARPPAGLRVVESPHAVYSTDPAGLFDLLDGPPASLHLAEDVAEREFVTTGGGPFAELRARMGGPAGAAGLGPLAGGAGRAEAEGRVAHRPRRRSRRRRPGAAAGLRRHRRPLPALQRPHLARQPTALAAARGGIPLAVGTDSLASSPSLAPLAELGALHAANPAVPALALLPLAWNGAAVGAPLVGRLAAGTAPGLLAAPLDGLRVDDPFRFLVTGSQPLGRRVEWLARHRPEVHP